MQKDSANQSRALVCISSFCKENSHQSIQSCPLCTALHVQWRFSHKWNGCGAPPSVTSCLRVPCSTVSRNGVFPMFLQKAGQKALGHKHVSFPGYAYWKDFLVGRLNCNPGPHQFWTNFKQCLVNGKPPQTSFSLTISSGACTFVSSSRRKHGFVWWDVRTVFEMFFLKINLKNKNTIHNQCTLKVSCFC